MPPTSVRIPAWADPQQASVLDSWYQKAARMIGSIIGAADPTAQAMGIAAPVEFPETGALGIRAYHGSPHDFERFDASKIGTGEGAQAYGHGLYFAENPATAQEYKNSLGGRAVEVGGQRVTTGQQQWAVDALQRFDGDAAKAKAHVDWETAQQAMPQLYADGIKRHIDEFAGKPIREVNTGKTYEVNIHASPDELLDWDKPLSQQPHFVKRLKQAAKQGDDFAHDITTIDMKDDPSLTGSDLYDKLRYKYGEDQAAATDHLNRVGIKGIQYLDQGSRAAGQGTRNFVIFPGNEHLIDIARKYGVTLPVAAQMYREMQDRQSHDQPGGIQAHAAQYLK